jgi:hypothetical protein
MEQAIACPSVSYNDKGLIKRSLNFPAAGARIGARIAGIAAAFRKHADGQRHGVRRRSASFSQTSK